MATRRQTPAFDERAIRREIVGLSRRVPLLGGGARAYVNFDNAATTPALRIVRDRVGEFLEWYSSIHRGTGYKSQLATRIFDETREVVARFVGARLHEKVVLYTKNTTESVNKLARRIGFRRGDVVLSSGMEHHSNDLPWRQVAKVEHVRLLPDHTLDLDDLHRRLRPRRHGRVRLLAISGSSNVTGYLPPIHLLAHSAHEAGAEIAVDAAQLIPHRAIDMRPESDPEHFDYLMFSAHKMYAPFGTGVLIGGRRTFDAGEPDQVGGGTVDIVTLDRAYWAPLPDREEAGTPNVVGALALATAIRFLESVGMENIAAHERELTAQALLGLRAIPRVVVYGDVDPTFARDRVGAIPFNLHGMPDRLVAAILGFEGGIGVRSGCFCAHPFIQHLLGISDEEQELHADQIRAGDRSQVPGLLRISFGIYNTAAELRYFLAFLRRIAEEGTRTEYLLERSTGAYRPRRLPRGFFESFRL